MPNQGAIVAILAVAGLVSAFQFTLVVPIQASLPELLNASRQDTAWVVTATLLAAAVTTPIAGRLGDMYGKRRVLLTMLATAATGSVVAALSGEIIGVIVGRALQGTMVAVIPLGISILRDVLHARRVDSAVALISATLGMGGALGLPISALITQHGDWHLLFWVSGALIAVVFGLVLWVIPVSVLRTPGRFDFLGAAGLAAGLIAVLLAISRGDEWGWLSPTTLGCGLGGLVVLLAWGWYQLRTPAPLLDLRVAARRPVLLTNIASLLMGFALFASNVAYPQMLGLPVGTGAGFGLTLIAASFVVMPSGLVMMVLSPFSGHVARTVGPKILLVGGAAALVLAYGFTLLWSSEVWHILVANLLVGVGIGLGYASMPMLIMRSVPQSETGASNGLNSLCRALGTSVAAAAVGAVLAAFSTTQGDVQVPTPQAFQMAFVLGGATALAAMVTALFIPSKAAEERHPSMPG